MGNYASPPTPDPAPPIRRLTPGFEVPDDGAPGMFYKADGSLWLRDPLGAEVELGSGNGGSTPFPLMAGNGVPGFDFDDSAIPLGTVYYEQVLGGLYFQGSHASGISLVSSR